LNALRAGSVIADRYRIVPKAGSGRMASVYEAHDGKRDRAVALKIPNANATFAGVIAVGMVPILRLQPCSRGHGHTMNVVSQPSSSSGAAGSVQLRKTPLQVGWQRPFWQAALRTWFWEHGRPHAPQFSVSVLVSVHFMLQLTAPPGHEVPHWPDSQVAAPPVGAGQTRVQLPQWSMSELRSRQAPLQFA
jgi:hypothetical protein